MSETMTKDKDGSAVPAGGSTSRRAAAVQIPADAAAWWEQHDQRVYQCIKIWVEQWWASEAHSLHAAVGEIFGEHRASIRTTTTGLSERVARLETASNYEERFAKLAYEAKREPEIPQGELLAKIEDLQRQADEFNRVAELDARFGELAERVGELEKTNSLEARFSKLAHEVNHRSEIPQGELLAKIEGLQRQVDGNRVANLDVRFRELAERVGELEKTNSLGERFSQLEHQLAARQGTLLSQDQLLEKIEAQQRQVDGNRVADMDTRFRELAERVGELEKPNSLEARLTKLANEAKGGPEIQLSALLARIEGLQCQLDELKTVAAQGGPQGPPGPPGKLPHVKEYVAECVHYEGDVVTHAGALWQARADTVHAPPHDDWTCLARRGHDAMTPNVCGTFNAYGKYKKLDIVVSDGAAFIAKRDNPGVCPGDDWQLISRQGKPGRRGDPGERGPRGEKGERGETGPTLRSWQLDREHYRVSPLMNDGTVWPTLELRGLFEQFLLEVDGGYNEAER